MILKNLWYSFKCLMGYHDFHWEFSLGKESLLKQDQLGKVKSWYTCSHCRYIQPGVTVRKSDS